MGLTMVPPMLIGSLDTVFKFRAGWIRDLRDMRRNLRAGVMKVSTGRVCYGQYNGGVMIYFAPCTNDPPVLPLGAYLWRTRYLT